MDPRRAWFFAALAMFAVWVAALAYLAATSAEKPQARPAAAAAESR